MSRRLNRLPGRGLSLALRPVNLLLSGLGGLAGGGGAEPLEHRPVFIIGAPRCGSTLLYQALVETSGFGYLSNFHCLFHGAPALVHGLSRRFTARKPAGFRSHYGRVRGLAAPTECGEFWYRFFRRRPQYVAADEMEQAARDRLRGAVRRLIEKMDRPLLIKNLLSSVRLRPLATALPEALFIVLRRDEVDTAASLLEGRRRLYGDYGRWFSVEPPNIEQLRGLPVAEQVVEQVRAVYRLIERDREAIGRERFVDLSYEELCEDTHGTLGQLSGFLGSHGITIDSYGTVPRSFSRRGGQADAELLEAVTRYATLGRPDPPVSSPGFAAQA